MRVLALDTTTPAGSVALVEDVEDLDAADRVVRVMPVVTVRGGDPTRTHAARLPADLLAVLDACGLTVADVDLFAVASGPGSFTGLRIGIATIQGLALVRQRRVVGVSALEALAQIAGATRAPGAIVAAWMNAHRREVFSALYRVTDAAAFTPDRLVEIEGPAVGDPGAMLAGWTGRHAPAVFVGDGAVVYGETIRGCLAHAEIVDPPPMAGAIGRLAIARARAGDTVDPAGLRPVYVRRPDAEIGRETRAFTTKDATETKAKT
jgi:tRNA threonylcarbamoyladenosine biosynthesis protein TsaB